MIKAKYSKGDVSIKKTVMEKRGWSNLELLCGGRLFFRKQKTAEMTRKTRKRAPPTTIRMARMGVTVNSPTLVRALSPDSVIRSEN